MISEEIKKLLTSDIENDQLLGWEIIEVKRIPFHEVMAYIKEVNTTSTEYNFYWSMNGFRLNKFPRYASSMSGYLGSSFGITASVLTITNGVPSWTPTPRNLSSAYPNYTHSTPLNQIQNAQVQKKTWLGIPRKIRAYIKALIKRIF